MIDTRYREARKMALDIASSFGDPLFYREQEAACSRSCRHFEENDTVGSCLRLLEGRETFGGHGVVHAKKVAIDAGAIIIVEGQNRLPEPELTRLVFLAHLAGLLHDIARSQKNHAHRGALEARNVLAGLDLPEHEILIVTEAIRNHEAFRPCRSLANPAAQLLSDALYDADKFRWGPDNFTEMLWDMLSLRPLSLPRVMERFLPGLEGVEKIRDTFRSATGKTYGPDFIDRGVGIGRRLYKELAHIRD
ncbi:MAG: hypothetical protein M0Q23_02225 [Syntrophales bacterium]|jgi:hypothetical protein|nr:hypothetical protein [Syntrophales bacterium]MCK9527465.1 hypothetical protein [Syntrophales bacterium]MDX9921569.1 hypothetical protein [Syntrophales bacterium]